MRSSSRSLVGIALALGCGMASGGSLAAQALDAGLVPGCPKVDAIPVSPLPFPSPQAPLPATVIPIPNLCGEQASRTVIRGRSIPAAPSVPYYLDGVRVTESELAAIPRENIQALQVIRGSAGLVARGLPSAGTAVLVTSRPAVPASDGAPE
jgi:hypothetical protein